MSDPVRRTRRHFDAIEGRWIADGKRGQDLRPASLPKLVEQLYGPEAVPGFIAFRRGLGRALVEVRCSLGATPSTASPRRRRDRPPMCSAILAVVFDSTAGPVVVLPGRSHDPAFVDDDGFCNERMHAPLVHVLSGSDVDWWFDVDCRRHGELTIDAATLRQAAAAADGADRRVVVVHPRRGRGQPAWPTNRFGDYLAEPS